MTSGMDKLEKYLVNNGKINNTDNRLLRDIVYHRIFDGIRNARLKPGDALSEPRLAKALGISRTPVREALHSLVLEGLLEVIPGRAVLIASPSIQKIFDSLYLRELLEPEMMKMVAENRSDTNLEKLKNLTLVMEQAAKSGERAAWYQADNEWHELMSASCPNSLLGDMVLQVRNRITIVSSDENVTDGYLIDGTKEHMAIVEALESKDGEKAFSLVKNHLKHLREDIQKRYKI